MSIQEGGQPVRRRTHDQLGLVWSEEGASHTRAVDRAVTIGRAAECDIRLAAPHVSRVHCRVHQQGTQLLIDASESTNGITVRGQRVQWATLRAGESFEIGGVTFRIASAGVPRTPPDERPRSSDRRHGARPALPVLVAAVPVVLVASIVAVVLLLGGGEEPSRIGPADGARETHVEVADLDRAVILDAGNGVEVVVDPVSVDASAVRVTRIEGTPDSLPPAFESIAAIDVSLEAGTGTLELRFTGPADAVVMHEVADGVWLPEWSEYRDGVHVLRTSEFSRFSLAFVREWAAGAIDQARRTGEEVRRAGEQAVDEVRRVGEQVVGVPVNTIQLIGRVIEHAVAYDIVRGALPRPEDFPTVVSSGQEFLRPTGSCAVFSISGWNPSDLRHDFLESAAEREATFDDLQSLLGEAVAQGARVEREYFARWYDALLAGSQARLAARQGHRIVLVGHSAGGAAALYVAQVLAADGFAVELLVELDTYTGGPVQREPTTLTSGLLYHDGPTPPNVLVTVNRYQQEPLTPQNPYHGRSRRNTPFDLLVSISHGAIPGYVARGEDGQTIRLPATGAEYTTSATSEIARACGAESPPVRSVPDRIVFTERLNDDTSVIYVMNADGSNQTQLPASGRDWGPRWSPDGSRIAFTFYRDGVQGMYVMNADGSEQTRITHSSGIVSTGNFEPAWSPDSSRIAFTYHRDGVDGLHVMNADGSELTRLTDGSDRSPVWSPDGRKIAFASLRDGKSELYVIGIDGSGRTRLGEGPYPTRDGAPAWSPDGSRIAFRSVRDGHMYVMNADGSGLSHLVSSARGAWQLSWSPSGDRIAFVTLNDRNFYDIYVVEVSGSTPARLTNSQVGGATDPRWSPDGELIAFLFDGDEPSIYVMNADGTNPVSLTKMPRSSAGNWDISWRSEASLPATCGADTRQGQFRCE